MLTTKNIAYAFTGMALCSMLFWGCSENQDKKVETRQEQLGREAAQNLQKPMEDARKAAAQAGAKADQALKEVPDETKKAVQEAGSAPTQANGKEKKKLEGC
jgi:hypothetical protein